jgi:hypothetical protein
MADPSSAGHRRRAAGVELGGHLPRAAPQAPLWGMIEGIGVGYESHCHRPCLPDLVRAHDGLRIGRSGPFRVDHVDDGGRCERHVSAMPKISPRKTRQAGSSAEVRSTTDLRCGRVFLKIAAVGIRSARGR